MKPRVYLETTIPSYLTAWPNRDLLLLAHQQATREWWDLRRNDFDLFVSQVVIDECQAGDPQAAADRLKAIQGVLVVEPLAGADELVMALIEQVPLPPKAATDALHIAIAALNGMDFLLTWNCTHIANAALRNQMESVCRQKSCELPNICTPNQLM